MNCNSCGAFLLLSNNGFKCEGCNKEYTLVEKHTTPTSCLTTDSIAQFINTFITLPARLRDIENQLQIIQDQHNTFRADMDKIDSDQFDKEDIYELIDERIRETDFNITID